MIRMWRRPKKASATAQLKQARAVAGRLLRQHTNIVVMKTPKVKRIINNEISFKDNAI